MRRKIVIFCIFFMLLCVIWVVPAFASCEECIVSEEQIEKNHCIGDCECVYVQCPYCGDGNYLEKYCGSTHDYKYDYNTPPTCTETGSYMRECLNCGDSETGTYPALNHDCADEVIASTCIKVGYTKWTCTRSGCTYSYTSDNTPALGHSFSPTTQTPPTCETAGAQHYVCGRCSETKSEPISALDHDYKETSVDPTCTEQGYTLYSCARSGCSSSYKEDYVDALGHSWLFDSTDEPTCTEDGSNNYKCTNDGCTETKSDPIAATGHAWSFVSTDYPTCIEEGAHYYECTNDGCTETKSETLPTSDHNWGDWEYDNLKYSTGYGRECADCGERQEDNAPSCSHTNYTEVDGLTVTATCLEAGYVWYECDTCKHRWRVDIAALGHQWGPAEYDDKYLSGYGQTCTACGENKSLALPSCDHVNKTEIEDERVDPTCTAAGSAKYTCDDCGRTLTVSLNRLDHVYGDYEYSNKYSSGYGHECTICHYLEEATKPSCSHVNYTEVDGSRVNATCTEKGYVSYKCDVCGEIWQVDLDKLPHTWSEPFYDDVFDDPDNYGRSCTVCSEIESLDPPGQGGGSGGSDTSTTSSSSSTPDPIEPGGGTSGHQHNYTSTVYAPTCTKSGYTLYACSCGDTYRDNVVGAQGHAYEGKVIKPTCENHGYTKYTCTRCNDSYTDNFTNATGHVSYTSTVTAPTCTTEGYTDNVCTACGYDWISDRVPALKHVIVDNVCTRCGYIAACIHEYSEQLIKPTCFAKGYTLFTCTKCGEQYVDNYIDEIDHIWTFISKTDPKCGVEGYSYYVCKREGCTEEKYEPIKALSHDWVSIGADIGEDNMTVVTYECSHCKQNKTETVPTAAAQAQNWLLTSIRGFSGALIEMYETVANGVEIGGVTLEEVIAGCLILSVVLCFLAFAGGWFKKR